MQRRLISTRKLSFSGFTLLRLSVVLIVIGLLAAGVLVGQSLIAKAEIEGAL